jgi:hypothetical protein
VEGDEPPLEAADFDAVDFAAGAEFDAEFDAGAGAGAGAADFAGAAAAVELLAGAAEESDAAVDFFERDFLVVESAAAEPVFDASVFAAVEDFEASVDAAVDESAAAFFERDFFVLPVEESEAVEALESSAAAFDFLDFEVPVDDVEAELSSDAAADFFLDFVDEPVVLESSAVVLPSAAAFFFFFLVVVLLSEPESLALLADDEVDWAFADFAATDADPRTKTAHASAVNICCQIVFMIVPPVSNDAKCGLRVLLVGEASGVGLGLFEQAGRCGRFESGDAAIEMAAERGGQVRFEMVYNGVDNFLGLILRQAGLLHDDLDEFVHG